MRNVCIALLWFFIFTGNALSIDKIRFKIVDPKKPTEVTQNPVIGYVRIILDVNNPNGWKGPQTLNTVHTIEPLNEFFKNFGLPNKPNNKKELSCEVGSIDETINLTYIKDLEGQTRRYEFVFNLESNVINVFVNNMPGNETWEIWMKGGKQIIAATIQSMYLDENGITHYLSGNEGFSTEPAFFVDENDVKITWTGSYENERPPIALAMVLDKSGSMWDSSGFDQRTRIQVLHDAVEDLIYIWNEDDVPVTGDKVGIVVFDTTASWWSGLQPGLNDFGPSAGKIADGDLSSPQDPIRSITPGGSTSIGAGVLKAAAAFGTIEAERNVVLVFSDGDQNIDPLIAVSPKGRVYTHPEKNPIYDPSKDIPNQDNFQIYTITMGDDASTNGKINQDIAKATGGFHLNSGLGSKMLRIFFLQMLQNFLRFNTVETSVITSGTCEQAQPFEMEFFVSGGTKWFIFSLMFNRTLGVMKVTLTPPNNGPQIVATGRGAIHMRPQLTEIAPVKSYTGKWKAKLEVMESAEETKEFPFNIMVQEDSIALKSEFEVSKSDIKPGDNISVNVQLNVLGQTVTGLDADPNGKVSVHLVKSSISIGDLLSSSKASTKPLTPNDSLVTLDASAGAAAAKLANAFKADPDILILIEKEYTLTDNGSGNYEALIPTDVEGIYTLLFTIKGKDARIGNYMRQQIRTINVIPCPDSGQTMVNTSIVGGVLNLEITPKTKPGHKLGPGWANRLWFKAEDGRITKPEDHGDGTYSASFNLIDNEQPRVDLFFIDSAVLIADDTPVDRLPVPLDEKNRLIQDMKEHSEKDGIPPWIWLLIILVLIGGAFIVMKKST